VTFGATVTLGAGVVTVVVFCCTVVVLVETLGMVALVLPESPFEMIAAASPPSARTTTTPNAISQPLVPDRCGWDGGGA